MGAEARQCTQYGYAVDKVNAQLVLKRFFQCGDIGVSVRCVFICRFLDNCRNIMAFAVLCKSGFFTGKQKAQDTADRVNIGAVRGI